MELHKQVKEAIKTHKKRIELTQWAITSGIATLLYSEFLANMRHKHQPVHMIMVPSIRNVQEFLLEDGPMFQTLSDKLIDGMIETELFKLFKDAPELEMFLPENIELLKTIFDLCMIPNISRRLPETIARKFNLFDENQQLFRESRDLDLFHRQPFNEEQLTYVIEESVLQLFSLMPSMKKEIEFPEDNRGILMTEEEVLTIGNQNDISPLIFNNKIIDLPNVIKLLQFVSNSIINHNDWNTHPWVKEPDKTPVAYLITTGVMNTTCLTRFTGIAEVKEDEGEEG